MNNNWECKHSGNLKNNKRTCSHVSTVKVSKCSPLSNTKGISLIEVVLAVAIMGIAFVSFLSLFSMSSRTTAYTGEKTDMTMVAQELMEQSTVQEGFSNLSANGFPAVITIRNAQYAERFDAVRKVELVDSDKNQGKLKKVTIQVKVKSEPDYEKGVILVTLVGDSR